jgi:radical SAM superfamily enzyme YgiQ (UPF0313 family)
MRALLISTYELGRQPFGLASPAAWLRREGWDVDCIDASKDRVTDSALAAADLIGVHLPMHTATRLAGPLLVKARRLNRTARVCAYGLYAPLNEAWLSSLGVDEVLGGEFEEDLAAIARSIDDERSTQRPLSPQSRFFSAGSASSALNRRDTLPRLQFLVPDRSTLPPLARYATLHMPDGTRKTVGSTEASRGCKHLCRHCPIVPVYRGAFRIVQHDVVLADVAAHVASGAGHITFGDPDFFNGPTHALRIVDALHAAYPELTYDVTIKVEHLLKNQDLLPRLAATGCAFVTSAVESIDDRVLALLDKGHTRADFFEAVAACRAAELAFVPTFVAFHPWLSLGDYCDLLDTIAGLDLVERVAPIQLAIRLLVPAGSLLLERDELLVHLGPFDPATLAYPWTHPDERVDALHRDITALVGTRLASDRRGMFEMIRALACDRAGRPQPAPLAPSAAGAVPFLDEPWYCCAEPNPDDIRLI